MGGAELHIVPGKKYSLREIVTGHHDLDLSPEEVEAIKWQNRRLLDLGSFWTSFYEALSSADEYNLQALAKGYPTTVSMLRKWRNDPEFARRLRSMPFAFSI